MQEPKLERIHITLDQETHRRVIETLPYGIRSEVMRCLLRKLVDQIDNEGGQLLGAILCNTFQFVKTEGSGNV